MDVMAWGVIGPGVKGMGPQSPDRSGIDVVTDVFSILEGVVAAV
jgi:hypothetical protein